MGRLVYYRPYEAPKMVDSAYTTEYLHALASRLAEFGIAAPT